MKQANTACGIDSRPTWLLLARLGHVGDTGVRAHEDVAGVQVSLQKVLLGVTDVDASEGGLWEGVGWDERQAVQTDLVDTVNSLQGLCTFVGVDARCRD